MAFDDDPNDTPRVTVRVLSYRILQKDTVFESARWFLALEDGHVSS